MFYFFVCFLRFALFYTGLPRPVAPSEADLSPAQKLVSYLLPGKAVKSGDKGTRPSIILKSQTKTSYVRGLKGIKGNSRNKEFIEGKSGVEKLSIKTVIFEMSLILKQMEHKLY